MRGYRRLLKRRYGPPLAKTDLVISRIRSIGKQKLPHVKVERNVLPKFIVAARSSRDINEISTKSYEPDWLI